MNFSGNVHFKTFLLIFILNSALECLFFGKNTVIDDDNLLIKWLFLYLQYFLHSYIPYPFYVGSWLHCLLHSLCFAFVYSDKIVYKHKCLQ